VSSRSALYKRRWLHGPAAPLLVAGLPGQSGLAFAGRLQHLVRGPPGASPGHHGRRRLGRLEPLAATTLLHGLKPHEARRQRSADRSLPPAHSASHPPCHPPLPALSACNVVTASRTISLPAVLLSGSAASTRLCCLGFGCDWSGFSARVKGCLIGFAHGQLHKAAVAG
jgi:hypothetical protein